jgi:hypothetical protein
MHLFIDSIDNYFVDSIDNYFVDSIDNTLSTQSADTTADRS